MKIIGIGVVGPAEAGRYMKKTLDTFKLCDEVILCCNNVTDKEIALIRAYGYSYYHDNREWGIYQPKIKEQLVRMAYEAGADWILSLDMDESFGSRMTRPILEALCNTKEVGWYFYFLQKWNDEEHMNESLGFWDLRLFKARKDLGYKFESKNVHCGMGPKWAYVYGFYAPYVIVHRGLMNKEHRRSKIARYEKYDPKAVFCSRDYYETLKSDYPGTPYDEKLWEEKVAKDVASYGPRIIPQIVQTKKMKQYRVLRLADEQEMIISEQHLTDTLNQGGYGKYFKLLGELPVEENLHLAEAPVEITTPKEVNPNQCVICGKEFKNANGLRLHAKVHA